MKKRIVVKVGSNVLTRSDGKTDVARMAALVDQIAWLRRNDYEVILVSSGAIAGGRDEVNTCVRLNKIAERQLFSAIGQVRLMRFYYDLFREYNIHIGQVLTMKENFSSRNLYLNQRSCMEVMLENGVLPIVNENDTASLTELMFTDNDELSGLVASMMSATTLVLLSNVDGICNGPPANPRSRVIPVIYPGRDVSEYIYDERSDFGRGGMLTKCSIARRVADEGIKVIIANGRRDNILIDLAERSQQTLHTVFMPNPEGTSTMKKWIAHSGSFAKGVITVNDSAADALRGDKAASVLLVGVTRIEGDFDEGDIVSICDGRGKSIAIGRSAYGSEEARANIGKHNIRPIVHYDYLYME